MELSVMVGLTVVASIAALALGLYIGQLGRNRDLRELARLQLEREQEPARVMVRDPSTGEMVEADEDETKEPILQEDERERMVKDLIEESPVAITKEEARDEVDRILQKASSMGHGS